MTAAWFRTAAFKANAAGQLGTSGRNILDKPGTKRVDLGLMRIFKLGERIEMPFKAEATNAFKKDNKTAKLPADDRIPVQISDITGETVVLTYPVMEYGHVPGGGDAIGAGLLYNGKAIPIRRGKYVFSDITTGRIWYAD